MDYHLKMNDFYISESYVKRRRSEIWPQALTPIFEPIRTSFRKEVELVIYKFFDSESDSQKLASVHEMLEQFQRKPQSVMKEDLPLYIWKYKNKTCKQLLLITADVL